MKVVTLEPDNALNRVVCMTAANFTLDGKLWNKLLGFSTPGTSLAGSATTYSPIIAANAAKIDSARAVAFHCPTLSAGAYSTSGVKGGSTLGVVPIDVAPGEVLSWEASIPIYLPCRASGGIVDRLHFFLTNEDGDPIDLLGDRYSAVVVVDDSQ